MGKTSGGSVGGIIDIRTFVASIDCFVMMIVIRARCFVGKLPIALPSES